LISMRGPKRGPQSGPSLPQRRSETSAKKVGEGTQEAQEAQEGKQLLLLAPLVLLVFLPRLLNDCTSTSVSNASRQGPRIRSGDYQADFARRAREVHAHAERSSIHRQGLYAKVSRFGCVQSAAAGHFRRLRRVESSSRKARRRLTSSPCLSTRCSLP